MPDPAALGYQSVALLGVRVRGPVAPVAEALADFVEVGLLVLTFGTFDLLVEVLARDEDHLLDLLDERIRSLAGVERCSVHRYLRVVKWTPSGLFPTGAADGAAVDPVVIDDVDRALLRELQRDGRASFQELAAATGLSYANARRRTRALLDGGAVRIVTAVNRVATGGAVMAGVALSITGPVEPVVRGLEALDEVEFAALTTGAHDVFMEVACADRARLSALVSDEIRTIEGVVRSETFPYARMPKLSVQWSIGALLDVSPRLR